MFVLQIVTHDTRPVFSVQCCALLKQLKEFKARPFWDFECGAEAGRKALGEAEEALGKERKKLDAATHLCTLFEFPDAIKESQRMIADMESNCKLMYKVRDSCARI